MLKKNNELRFYINYRVLNAIIIKNRYLFSLIFETLNRLYESKVFINWILKMFIIDFALKSTTNKRRRFEFVIIISNIWLCLLISLTLQ